MRKAACWRDDLLKERRLLAGAEVARAASRWGAGRVAVVMGTSTSGIAEGEAALARLRGEGYWPAGYDYRQQELGSPSEFAAVRSG